MFNRAPEALSTPVTELYCLLWLKSRVSFLSEAEIEPKAELTATSGECDLSLSSWAVTKNYGTLVEIRKVVEDGTIWSYTFSGDNNNNEIFFVL
jgi:hypothetical protein